MATSTDCLNPLSDAPRADRILVIRLGALGDVVRTLPAVAGLRRLYPMAQISWLVEPASAGVVAACREIDDVIVLPRPALEAELRGLRIARLVRRLASVVLDLRSRRFDLVVDWHGILKSGLLARSSGASVRVGYAAPYARELSSLLLNRRARLCAPPLSRFRRNAGLVTFLAGPAGEEMKPEAGAIALDPATRHNMADALGGGRRQAVVMHPGTSAGTPFKRWPAQRYSEVARRLARETGRPCVVTAGPRREERALALAVVAGAGGAARLAPATEDLVELAALYAACALFIGSDSGPLHVASAVGTPVVQLIGPTHPVENEPNPATPWRRVRVDMPCSPCRRGCAEVDCMNAISSEQVIEAALDLLGDALPLARSAP
jgi:ADP-heptose:LPS heptosyltransferase